MVQIEDYNDVYIDILKPRFAFAEIAGYEEVIERFRDMVVIPMKYPEQLEAAGIVPPTGLIVWGPLGVGKGHMIESAAGEAGTNYMIIRGRECTDHPEVIHKAFAYARENRPMVIHMMDIDWLAPRKDFDYTWSDGTTDGKPDKLGSEEVHKAVHEEVASVAYEKDIMVCASAYRIDALDQAFTRTTMLGRKIYVPRPDQHDREELFKMYLKDATLAEEVDITKLAEMTDLYIGWDIEALCRKAKLNALQRSQGKSVEVTMDDFKDAKEKVRAWLSPEMAKDYDEIMATDCLHKYNF